MKDFEEDLNNLILQYKNCTDEKKKKLLHIKIVELSLVYVKKIVSSPTYKICKMSEDLFQVGCIGLMKAIDFFDINKNTKFKTYATYFIKGEIKHYLRDKASFIKPPREIQELSYKIAQAARELNAACQDGSSIDLIAEKLNLPKDKVEDVMSLSLEQEILSLDQKLSSDDEEDLSLMDKIPDGNYKDFLSSSENRLMISSALEKLSEDLKEILILNYYRDLTQKDISKKLGLTPMQVSRKIKKALNKLYELINTEDE